MKTARNPDVVKWQCSRCGTWNTIEDGTCKQCGVPSATHAKAFRLSDTLSSDEKTFYSTVMPELLREIRSIRRELENIHEVLKENDYGRNI